jgi:hypothetical protein
MSTVIQRIRSRFDFKKSGAFVARHYEDDTADQTKPAQNRRQRNSLFPIRANLQRAGIYHLLALGVCKTPIGKCDDADNDQNNSDNTCGFHAGRGMSGLKHSTALDQINDQHNDGNNQEDMNKASQCV